MEDSKIVRLYGDRNELAISATSEKYGHYDMYIAEFEYDNIHYQITAKQLNENEIIKVVGSIIYGEEVIIGES